MLLATEFTKRGHEVVVVTETRNQQRDDFPFEVLRRPKPRQMLEAVRWSDVFFQNNISLRTLWPLALVRKPWVVRHATWIRRMDGSLAWQDRLKRYVLRFSVGISNSRATADDLPVQTVVIENSYRDGQFRLLPDVRRDQDIVFLGRLVSDKGPALLLESLRHLRTRGLTPSATFVGEGPESGPLQGRASDWGLEDQVKFVGQKSGEELVRLLNQHRILAVPSVWHEPFGIVALEGIATGCVVVGSEGGGLKDAIGACGVTFRNGDMDGLTDALESLLRSPERIGELRNSASTHLASHTAEYVASRYLEVLAGAVDGRS